MGVRFPSVFTFTQLNALPASAVETLLLTTPPITQPFDFAPIRVSASIAITAGTGTTAIVLNLRRGALVTSTLIVGPCTHTLAAGSSAILHLEQYDTGAALAQVQYSLTIIQTGATVAGTTSELIMDAFIL